MAENDVTLLSWDGDGERRYQTGVDKVALFVDNKTVVAWNGVTAINEAPSGAEPSKIYADNINYLTLFSKEEFGLTLECYCTPAAFDECDGTMNFAGLKVHGQSRKKFGLVYRVLNGSDTKEPGSINMSSGQSPADVGANYTYHIVYGCKASPSSRDNATVNDSPEAQTLSFEITTTPITTGIDDLDGITELSHIEIDCSTLAETKRKALEEALYNSALTSIPTPNALYGILSAT